MKCILNATSAGKKRGSVTGTLFVMTVCMRMRNAAVMTALRRMRNEYMVLFLLH